MFIHPLCNPSGFSLKQHYARDDTVPVGLKTIRYSRLWYFSLKPIAQKKMSHFHVVYQTDLDWHLDRSGRKQNNQITCLCKRKGQETTTANSWKNKIKSLENYWALNTCLIHTICPSALQKSGQTQQPELPTHQWCISPGFTVLEWGWPSTTSAQLPEVTAQTWALDWFKMCSRCCSEIQNVEVVLLFHFDCGEMLGSVSLGQVCETK